MKIPYVKAVDKDTGIAWEGFYFTYPKVTYCFTSDYEAHPVEMVPCLVTYRSGDWGLPNTPVLVSNIDRHSIQLIGYVDTELSVLPSRPARFYVPTDTTE